MIFLHRGRKRSPLGCIVALASAISAGAQSQTFTVSPAYSLPLNAEDSIVSAGAGADLDVEFPKLFGAFDGFFRAGYRASFLESGAGTIHIASLGVGPSWQLIDRGAFSLGVNAQLGAFAAMLEGSPTLFNPSSSARLDARVGLGSMSLGLSPGIDVLWSSREGSIVPFDLSLRMAVSISFEGGEGARKPKLRIEAPELRPFFPVIYKYYADNPVGTVVVKNAESSEIRDVKVEFFIPSYMDGAAIVAEFPALKPGEAREVDLTALLRNEVLGITETDAVQAEIVVGYSLKSTPMSVRRSANLRIESRNSISWDDDRKAAAFVTAKDPTILKLSRNALAAAGSGGAVFSESFRKGMIAYSSLAAYGLRYVIDPSSSYKELSEAASAIDYVQFPVQTLDYMTGDCDDLTVLYCSFLEALGVETAFITTPGHIFAAFALDLSELEAQRVFSSTSDLIVRDGKVWVPIEATALDKGFLAAWADGSKQWREALASGAAGFFPVRESWSSYEPTFFSASEQVDIVARFPEAKRIGASFDAAMKGFVDREISVLERSLRTRISARSTPGLLNSLGTLYARYGLVDKAEASFVQAAKDNHAPALHNLGNIRFLKKDYRAALDFYERTIKANPDFAEAALGVARAQFELGRYDQARRAFQTARLIDPKKADSYAYLDGSAGATTARAADPALRSAVSWTD
jgi:hypothetical protein